jgi:hypothetical protein
MTAVYQSEVSAAPQVHALVIGVGQYTHLDQPAAAEFGLDPVLTSPPLSAAAFAGFVLDELDELGGTRALGSVDLYLSGATTFTSGRSGEVSAIDAPTTENVVAAIKAWAARCRSHEENLALFYFCGHGIDKARELGLLLADFGSEPNLFENSISVTALQGAMGAERSPRQQCFFVDACRQPSPEAMRYAGPVGRDVLGWKIDLRGAEDSSIFYATLPTDPAYGQTGDVAPFTRSLLRALRGLGVRTLRNGYWEVTTSYLQQAIRAAMRADGIGWKLGQRPQRGGWEGDLPVHRVLDPGEIPVNLEVQPVDQVQLVTLRRAGVVHQLLPGGRLALNLPMGEYVGSAAFHDAHLVMDDQEEVARPPEADWTWSAKWQ